MSAAPPEWTKTESSIEEAKNYLREGNTIDFFERISRCILSRMPEDIDSYALDLVKQAIEGKDIPMELEFQPQSAEAHSYMHEVNVSEFIDRWVLALLSTRPASDPERFEFHKQYLEGRIREKQQGNTE